VVGVTLTRQAEDRRNWRDPNARCEGTEDWHGTPRGYGVHRCRGDACREAKLAYNRLRNGIETKPPSWASRPVYQLDPAWLPDTMTRAELLAARGYA
jgi:hypothetical protein